MAAPSAAGGAGPRAGGARAAWPRDRRRWEAAAALTPRAAGGAAAREGAARRGRAGAAGGVHRGVACV